MKPKLYTVRFGDKTHVVEAVTKAGALKLAIEHERAAATVAIATPEQIYSAGASGVPVITAGANA